ncbi:MAG: putative toxin-antitoxin system toxin component, PIN family [Acidobacteriota bacterium]|nr:putative toxin-antitoxin system toxin component, PIN family [Acidobacteriota bacterium]
MKIWQIIIDTNVLVAALRSRLGASFKLLSLLRGEKFTFHLSVALVCEYEDVLKRENIGVNLSIDEIDKLLDVLCLLGEKHQIWYLWRPLLEDAKDEFIAELAINARVEAIVTHNVRHFKNMRKFGIKILTPNEFLHLIGEIK